MKVVRHGKGFIKKVIYIILRKHLLFPFSESILFVNGVQRNRPFIDSTRRCIWVFLLNQPLY